MRTSGSLLGAFVVVCIFAPSEASAWELATPARVGGDWSFDLDLRIGLQAKGARITRLPSGRFGGVEGQFNFAVRGLGAAAGVGVERLGATEDAGAETLYGGYLLLAAQWRPVAMFNRALYRWFDPHVDLGARAGGLESANGAAFRGALLLGAGVDVGIWVDKTHPVISLDYRFEPARRPDGVAQHFLLLGAGVRFAD